MPRCRCTSATVLATVALVLLLLELLTLVLPAPRPPTSQYAQPAHSNGSDSHSGEGDSDPPLIPLFRPGSGAGSVLPLQSEPFGARTPVTPTLSPSLSIQSPDRSVYTSFIHSPPDPGSSWVHPALWDRSDIFLLLTFSIFPPIALNN